MKDKDLSVEKRCEQYQRRLGGMTAAHNRLKDANRKLSAKLEEHEARIRELEEKLRDEKALVKDLLEACGECDQLRELELRIRQLEKEARNE